MDQSTAPAVAHSALAPRLIVVDDDRSLLEALGRLARPHGFEVVAYGGAAEALAAMSYRPPEVALVDLGTPGVSGMQTLQEIKHRAPHCAVVLMEVSGSVESAVEAIKRGAADYLRKPADHERLADMLGELRAEIRRRQTLDAIEDELIQHVSFHGMIGHSPAMLELFGVIRRIGRHFTTALVSGETGAGKQLVARALHATSKGRHRPFVTLHCSSNPEALIENDLVDHLQGIGPERTTPDGTLDRDGAGVLFLDEIGELPARAQTTLVRLLEAAEARRAVSPSSRGADIRIVAATNRTLEHEVQAGRFRSDLYLRLRVIELQVPPLRDRREDVPLLARGFVQAFAAECAKPIRGLTGDADCALASYAWPGNVRELKNVIGRASMLTEHQWIGRRDLALGTTAPCGAPTGPVRPMQEVEREQVVRALDETRGNKKEAARRLGISRRAFYRRLEKYGLYTPHGTGGEEIEETAA